MRVAASRRPGSRPRSASTPPPRPSALGSALRSGSMMRLRPSTGDVCPRPDRASAGRLRARTGSRRTWSSAARSALGWTCRRSQRCRKIRGDHVALDVVGKLGRVTADITPGHLGEVLVEVRQGTERFMARSSDSATHDSQARPGDHRRQPGWSNGGGRADRYPEVVPMTDIALIVSSRRRRARAAPRGRAVPHELAGRRAGRSADHLGLPIERRSVRADGWGSAS